MDGFEDMDDMESVSLNADDVAPFMDSGFSKADDVVTLLRDSGCEGIATVVRNLVCPTYNEWDIEKFMHLTSSHTTVDDLKVHLASLSRALETIKMALRQADYFSNKWNAIKRAERITMVTLGVIQSAIKILKEMASVRNALSNHETYKSVSPFKRYFIDVLIKGEDSIVHCMERKCDALYHQYGTICASSGKLTLRIEVSRTQKTKVPTFVLEADYNRFIDSLGLLVEDDSWNKEIRRGDVFKNGWLEKDQKITIANKRERCYTIPIRSKLIEKLC